MSLDPWKKAVQDSADPQRTEQFLKSLRTVDESGKLDAVTPEQARIVCALLSGSRALSEWVLSHPQTLPQILDEASLKHPRKSQGLWKEINAWLPRLLQAQDYAAAFRKLREFKQKEMLRMAVRDLAGLSHAAEIIGELSDVADICISTVYKLCHQRLTQSLGQPYHPTPSSQWRPTQFCILGMGKLGGQELNYSSDVDLLFVYSSEGEVFKTPPSKESKPGKRTANHQFFKKLAESILNELSHMTSHGHLYRVDIRLRPEGESGPLVRSLDSYENYYAQWGQSWERMMLIKARCVAGSQELASEFLETIQPFRYPRSLSERILRETAEMKRRIEIEVVKSGELDRNVKLGRGGIREIEFIVQTLQLLNGGRQPFLQTAQTLVALTKLVQYRLLEEEEAETLSRAYCFFRNVEHRIQMDQNLQSHSLPTRKSELERIARLMNHKSAFEFETTRKQHAEAVRRSFDHLLKTEEPPPLIGLPGDIDEKESEWLSFLETHGLQDPPKALRLAQQFVRGPGYVHISPRTIDLAYQLLPRFFQLCHRTDSSTGKMPQKDKVLSDPDRVLMRLESFINAYGGHAGLYETWSNNPSVFELMLLLFDRSEFLAETAIRVPDLVDDLALGGHLRRQKNADEILHDLQLGRQDEDQLDWLRRYHQAEFMRIGLRDILGLADFELNLQELSNLADACLNYAMEIVLRRQRIKKFPFAIIGMGKLGGRELNYGSDLDIVFVADAKEKDLPRLQKIAVEVMNLLSSQTERGVAFTTDARLRPDGEKGLLVNTITAYEDYYRQRAMLWEIQTLTRARAVAGNMALGAKFIDLAQKLSDFSGRAINLASWSPHWPEEIIRMRERIEKERTPGGKQHLAIKTGEGGLVDAEFIAQTYAMAGGWHEPNTLQALEKIRTAKALPQKQAEQLIHHDRILRHYEGILRRWSFISESLLPEDPKALRRVAIRCGFANAEAFLEDVQTHRQRIREVYLYAMEQLKKG